MEILNSEVATYLEWLNGNSSNSAINIIFPTLGRKGIEGVTAPFDLDGVMTYLDGTVAPREDLGAVWSSIHLIKTDCENRSKVAISDVIAYRFLAIDLDNIPINGKRCSATDGELAGVDVLANTILQDLVKLGLPMPLKVCSGNGYLLLFPIDLPNSDANYSLMSNLAVALAATFNSKTVDVDTDVIKDPSRVCGLTGTMNRNRPQIPSEDRVWRMRKVVGDYPSREPMSEADFRAFAMGFIAAHKEQDEAPAPISEETSLPLRPTAPTAPSKTLDGDNCKQDLIRWAVAYLKKCAPANEGSKGDGKTFNTAGHLFAARCKHKWGLSQADVLGLMEKHYNPRCSPPWASSDLAEKVSSAFSNGTPRAVKTVDCEDKIVFSGETAAPINGLEGDRQYPTTDVGNCDAFLARYGSDLLYVPLWKAWMVWDGKRWARDTVNKVGQLAVQFVRQDMLAYASNIKEDNRRIAYLKHLLASQASYKIEGMLNVCMKDHCVDAAKFDRNGNLFNCLNGTLDLLDGTVSPHRKGDYLTKMAGVSFDPSATAPTWDKFVNRIFQGDDGENRDNLLNYVQRAVGYSMTAETVAQCLFVLWGNGRNGKTTFIEAILAMMGDYGLVGQQSLLLDDGKGKANGEDEVNLLGVRFASCSETNSGQRFDEAKIKRLVGTGKVRARRLYESSFEFEATHKLWLDCNHKPVVRNNDEGIWRRIKLIPFLQQIPFNERDEGLSEKLRAETSGVLNWALKGLMEWRKDRKLHEPSEVCNAVNGYRFESDYFGQFLSDCIEPNDADTAATDEVYRVFCRWMESNGMKQILSKIAFGKKMGERNYKTKVSTGKRYFMKMTLKTGDAADAAETADAETAAADADERAF